MSIYTYDVPDALLKTDAERLSVEGTLVSGQMDRVGHILKAQGANLETHRRRPVVFLMHNLRLPVGLAEDPDSFRYQVRPGHTMGQLLGTTYFDRKSRFGEECFRLAEERILSGLSVSFPVHNAVVSKAYAGSRRVEVVEQWELLEYSLVMGPVDPGAMISRVEKGYGGRRLCDVLETVLMPHVRRLRGRQYVVSGYDGRPADSAALADVLDHKIGRLAAMRDHLRGY